MAERPQLPPECVSTWRAFVDIGSEANYQEIKAYTEVTGTELDPWQVEAIIALNRSRNMAWQQNLRS